MKLIDIYRNGVKLLTDSNIESPPFNALCLMKKNFEIDKTFLLINGNEEADKEKSECFMSDIKRRVSGEPLQYIIGKWEFMGLDFYVGNGVLIPRPETELLVENIIPYANRGSRKVIYDLCAGTGCIGISIAAICKGAEVYSFEWSNNAYTYLERNIKLHTLRSVKPVKLDILQYKHNKDAYPPPDIIVSNPPYIPMSDIYTLQREVQYEPVVALDGGNDGLDFYRAISERWIPALKCGGIVAVECGINQAQDIADMFRKSGCCNIDIIKDYSGIERIVKGEKTIC